MLSKVQKRDVYWYKYNKGIRKALWYIPGFNSATSRSGVNGLTLNSLVKRCNKLYQYHSIWSDEVLNEFDKNNGS